MELLVVLLILWIIYDRIKLKRSTHSKTTSNTPQLDPTIEEYINDPTTDIEPEYKGRYQKRYLLTKHEYSEYKKLKEYASARNLLICPKVRLLDLIEPKRGDQQFRTLFYKIQAKHVDFVICDQNLYIKAILELDDNSHNQSNRQKRDKFVDAILTDVGYKVLRTRSITETTLDEI